MSVVETLAGRNATAKSDQGATRMNLARLRPDPARSQGQTLVLMVLALVGLLTMVGLVIDGGNAYARQRETQNATDAAAEAGAAQLLRHAVGVPTPAGGWNATVYQTVTQVATQNGITGPVEASYTDISGNVLGPVPNDSGDPPSNAEGVMAGVSNTFRTYLAGVVGINNLTATTTATAISGYAVSSGLGGVLPVTFPVVLTACDGTNKAGFTSNQWPYGSTAPIAIPLCEQGGGNVGWLDWTPTGGGAAELADAIATGNTPYPITTPKWYWVSQTGNINSGQVQTALEGWIGKDMLLPIFYAKQGEPPGTCDSTPTGTQTLLADCPIADRGGSGNQWYFLVTFASFHLDAAYVQGSHVAECNAPGLVAVTGGNGGSSCLVGYFNGPVVASNMTVGTANPYTTGYSVRTIQLIK